MKHKIESPRRVVIRPELGMPVGGVIPVAGGGEPVEGWMGTGLGGAVDSRMAARLNKLLVDMAANQAADLLLVPGWPPTYGIHGQWSQVGDTPLRGEDVTAWLRATLATEQWQMLIAARDLDFALGLPNGPRFRVNAHYARAGLAVAIRAIPTRVPGLAELNLPSEVSGLVEFPHGLVLVTGGTGHGKSTTLAALIQHLNETRACHVITLEDPVEYEFPPGLAIIEQREIGTDSPTFASALRHVLRQRPDVILVGEMRDLETISIALTAAETGHLVLATLHTCNVPSALSRIVDVFPAEAQPQVRTQLAASLRAILAQSLLPAVEGSGLLPAIELLLASDAVRRAIRDNETHLLYGMMETGRAAGMTTLEQSLAQLVSEGRISCDAARAAATHADRLGRLVG